MTRPMMKVLAHLATGDLEREDRGRHEVFCRAVERAKRTGHLARGKAMIIKAAAAMAAAFALAACATQQAPQNPGPYPANYAELAQGWLRTALVDPYSVRDLTITEPRPGRAWRGILIGGPFDAWATCVTFNAKNRMGGYDGLQTYVVWILNGAIVQTEPHAPDALGPAVSVYSCA
jgi:hypothetical protein